MKCRALKGQLSAEMLVLIVVILAIIGIAATQLMGTAKTNAQVIQNTSNIMIEDASKSILRDTGELCSTHEVCRSGTCDPDKDRCT